MKKFAETSPAFGDRDATLRMLVATSSGTGAISRITADCQRRRNFQTAIHTSAR